MEDIFSEMDAYNLILKCIPTIEETLKGLYTEGYSLNDPSVIAILCGIEMKRNFRYHPIYVELRDNWQVYSELGCTRRKSGNNYKDYWLSYRGVAYLLNKYNRLDYFLNKSNEVDEEFTINQTDEKDIVYGEIIHNKKSKIEKLLEFRQNLNNQALELKRKINEIDILIHEYDSIDSAIETLLGENNEN